MVEVVTTNIEDNEAAELLTRSIVDHFPGFDVNFDLEDCDRILRVAGKKVEAHEIIDIANRQGYRVTVLPD